MQRLFRLESNLFVSLKIYFPSYKFKIYVKIVFLVEIPYVYAPQAFRAIMQCLSDRWLLIHMSIVDGGHNAV